MIDTIIRAWDAGDRQPAQRISRGKKKTCPSMHISITWKAFWGKLLYLFIEIISIQKVSREEMMIHFCLCGWEEEAGNKELQAQRSMDGIKKNGGIKHPISPLRTHVIALHFNFIACVYSIEVNCLYMVIPVYWEQGKWKEKGGTHGK